MSGLLTVQQNSKDGHKSFEFNQTLKHLTRSAGGGLSLITQ